ncbi:hypothetical protein SteCoe_9215 [Stentor coeruleus]|uniref:Uncharacterized protein n=1 Tax=Stentor coeruleus TaxID=5963 RepID=A0A1R2CIC8_9CILI|nr:hypothetical protein SteCoe_9215 [Stentor coeruleus]
MALKAEKKKKREMLLLSSCSSYTEEQYGAVFDISEPSEINDTWREIKITFVKEDISHTEYLTFDRSVSNLNLSADEILNSLIRCLDRTNFYIVHMYLLDVTRFEKIIRITNQPIFVLIKPLVPRILKYKRKENTDLRMEYKKISGIDLSNQLVQMIKAYETHNYGDLISDAFNLIFMQKVDICLQLHQIACEHAMNSMEKSLDVSGNSEEAKGVGKKVEGQVDIEQKIKDIISKKEKERESSREIIEKSVSEEKEMDFKKSIFRDACECRIV